MKKLTCWLVCSALIALAVLSLCGCDRGTYTPAAQVKSHMAAKEKKEAATFKQ